MIFPAIHIVWRNASKAKCKCSSVPDEGREMLGLHISGIIIHNHADILREGISLALFVLLFDVSLACSTLNVPIKPFGSSD